VTLPNLAEIDTQIGGAIRAARLQTGTKQEDLASTLGLDRTTLSRYEAGSRSAPVRVLLQIAYALQVPVSELVPGMREMETAWAAPAVSPDLVDITQALAERPDLIPQV
jgi:transcriptional regulator with XRE-family HTH domain